MRERVTCRDGYESATYHLCAEPEVFADQARAERIQVLKTEIAARQAELAGLLLEAWDAVPPTIRAIPP